MSGGQSILPSIFETGAANQTVPPSSGDAIFKFTPHPNPSTWKKTEVDTHEFYE
jgi:hypothetical protein